MSGKCAELAELVSALADGELPEAERARVRAHLDECPPCRKLAETYRLLDGAVAGSAAPPAVPEARWTAVSAAVRAELRPARREKVSDTFCAKHPAGPFRQKVSDTFFLLRVAGYVLAAAAAALLAVFLGMPGRGAREPAAPSSAEIVAVEPSAEESQTQTLVMMAPEGGLNLVIVTSTAAAGNTGGG